MKLRRMSRSLAGGTFSAALAACGLAGAAASAAAGSISLQVGASSRVASGRAEAAVTVLNRGDEVALDVCASGELGGIPASSSTHPRLAPGERVRLDLAFPSLPSPPGCHTLVIRVRYADGRGYPFTALHGLPVYTRDMDPSPPLKGSIPRLQVIDTGTLTLLLSNAPPAVASAEARLVLPDELESPRPSQTAAFRDGRARVEFPVRNRWAVPGSAYQALVVVTLPREGGVDSHAFSGTVAVAARKDSSRLLIRVCLGLALACLAGFAVAQFRHGNSRF